MTFDPIRIALNIADLFARVNFASVLQVAHHKIFHQKCDLSPFPLTPSIIILLCMFVPYLVISTDCTNGMFWSVDIRLDWITFSVVDLPTADTGTFSRVIKIVNDCLWDQTKPNFTGFRSQWDMWYYCLPWLWWVQYFHCKYWWSW